MSKPTPAIELAELLRAFRDVEAQDQLAAVVDDRDAIRVLAAWRSVRWEWDAPSKRSPWDLGELWIWLWTGGRFDLEAIAAAVGSSLGIVEAALAVLVNARAVYPDGTISAHAQLLVEAHVSKCYPRRAVGRPKLSKNKPKETS